MAATFDCMSVFVGGRNARCAGAWPGHSKCKSAERSCLELGASQPIVVYSCVESVSQAACIPSVFRLWCSIFRYSRPLICVSLSGQVAQRCASMPYVTFAGSSLLGKFRGCCHDQHDLQSELICRTSLRDVHLCRQCRLDMETSPPRHAVNQVICKDMHRTSGG
jgi:hypothetical protein